MASQSRFSRCFSPNLIKKYSGKGFDFNIMASGVSPQSNKMEFEKMK